MPISCSFSTVCLYYVLMNFEELSVNVLSPVLKIGTKGTMATTTFVAVARLNKTEAEVR